MSSLQQPASGGPQIVIDLSALCANWQMLNDNAAHAETAAVVKCDAYGLGMAPVARALTERTSCDTFFVVYAEEGAALRQALNTNNHIIYVFNGVTEETLPLFEQYSLTPTLNSLEEANLWRQRMGKAPTALHVDTGMNRRGASMDEIHKIAGLDKLNITMVMSHLACASDPTHPKNKTQKNVFRDLASQFPDARLSLAASGGALMDKEFHFDLIRPGIALYGGSPFDEDDSRISAVASLRAPIVQLRSLKPGETVGYDATFTAQRPTTIATVAIGYGDGFPRAGANRTSGAIKGEKAPVVGRVSMDFVTLDVTDLKTTPKINDIVEFFGAEPRLHAFAQNCDRISYDLLTGLGGRADRRYL